MSKNTNFKERYKIIDNELKSLNFIMRPEINRTLKEIAEYTIRFHQLHTQRWEVKLSELYFDEWLKEQRYADEKGKQDD